MNKTVGIIVAVVAVFGVVGVLALSGGEDTQDSVASDTPSTVVNNEAPSSADTSPAPTQSSSGGEYVEYSEATLADASGDQRVLFFHAEWCTTCKFFEDEIKESGVPEGITIIEADYDNDTELRQRYGVNVQSTFILIDENDEAVRTWPFASGLTSAQDLFDAVASEA